MINPWLGFLLICLLMTALLCGLKGVEKLFHPHPELLRKWMHVGTGLTAFAFPWIFQTPVPVVLLACGSTAFLLAVKFVPRLHDGIGTVLHAVHRPSLGEICFPISICALILLSRGDKLLYAVPILIMTLADAVAALVGIAYGKVRYLTSDGFKSAEGSIAFLCIAFLSIHVPLLLFTDVPRPQTLLISALIAILSMLIEAISARGLDNLLIPLGAFSFLRLYQHSGVDPLVFRLVASIALVIFVLCWRRRSTLDDSGLIGCALYGYAAAMLGGTLWFFGPMILFIVHVALWPRLKPPREHTVYAVAAITLAGLFWLLLQAAYGGTARFFFPYAVGFGAHLAIIGVSRIAAEAPSRSPRAQLVNSILAGWGMTAIQTIPFLFVESGNITTSQTVVLALAGLCGVSLAAIGFYGMLRFIYGPRGSDAAIHLAAFNAAFVGSMVAAGLQLMFIGFR